MGHFTKKPVTIEAFRWTGGPDQVEDPVWICDAIRDGIVQFVEAGSMSIQTTEGTMNASPGDWIIRGVEGELYPCRDSVFQATYSPAQPLEVSAMSFGDAIFALKSGQRVARSGWNGKGMFLVLVPGSEKLTVDEGRPLAKAGIPVGTTFNYLPHIDMWTAQGDLVPWLASQTDVLANDWAVVSVEAA